MNLTSVLCPGGPDSQTGEAVKVRYPAARIVSCGETIKGVPQLLPTNPGPYVIPIWNSHAGEVKAAQFVWNSIEGGGIKLWDLWAKRIEFWFVRRDGAPTDFKLVGSVPVAETQCSGFLTRRGAKLKSYELTTVAFNAYRDGADLDGVLVAPGQGENEAGFDVAARQSANPNNFTSFVTLVRNPGEQRPEQGVCWLTGVTMRPLDVVLREPEEAFFEGLLQGVTELDQIPRLVFVLRRNAKIGLLFEGARLYAADLVTADDQERGDISVFEEAGVTSQAYCSELARLFAAEFPALMSEDFLLHRGAGPDTCLFACPRLGLYTHGFEINTVEPVVRFFISRLFRLFDDGVLRCSAGQRGFFERHLDAWRRDGSRFMQFTDVPATND